MNNLEQLSSDGQALYYHYNSIGSTIALTDSGGEIANQYSYTDFGEIISQVGTTENPFQYVGRYGVMTEPNDLMYMRDRYYDPEIGRFIQNDAFPSFAAAPFSLNGYPYAGGNPTVYIDASGKVISLGVIGGVIAAGGVIGGIVSGVHYWATAGDDFTLGGLGGAVGKGAVVGAAGSAVSLFGAAAVSSIGLSSVTSAVIGGMTGGGVSQLIENQFTGASWYEHLLFSTALGGVMSGVFSAVTASIPSLVYKGPAPSYAFGQLKPSYFGTNSWRWAGRQLVKSLGIVVIRKTLQIEFIPSSDK